MIGKRGRKIHDTPTAKRKKTIYCVVSVFVALDEIYLLTIYLLFVLYMSLTVCHGASAARVAVTSHIKLFCYP